MGAILLRKVAYKTPGPRGRLIWAVVLAENEGCAVLFVKRPTPDYQDAIVLAADDMGKYYEDVGINRFSFNRRDLMEFGLKIQAIAEGLEETELKEFFTPEDIL